jgi:acyl-CoA reductase-like NAD-dependent aldehyde dehydrogenase
MSGTENDELRRWMMDGDHGKIPAGTVALGAAARGFLAGGPKHLLIGDKWVPARSGETFEAFNPATEESIGSFAAGAKADIDEAVTAARRAFENPNWAAISPHQRSGYLLKLARLLQENAEELAQLESLNNGTPLVITRGQMLASAQTFEYYAGWATKIYGETNPSEAGFFNYTLREPLGVCGLIVPWNGPISSAAWKLAPALATGNTCILKPAEQTPLTSIRLGELILEAGFPPGVVNVVTGFGETAGAAISEHPDVDKVAFTGSTAVGKMIARAASGNLKKLSLELGGKSPNVIFEDADLDKAVAASVGGFCALSGQICVAGSRIFIQEKIYDEVVQRLADYTANFRVGDPFDPTTTMGPVASAEQYQRVTSYFDIAKADGARVAVGAATLGGKGYFIKPTLYADVRNGMRIAREEVFGPVAAAIPFKDENDAVLQGNDTIYGLAAAVWTKDVGRAHRVARALKAGTLWVNTYLKVDPISGFGGYKQSGVGRELGPHSIDAYTQMKSVYIDLAG